MSKRLTLGSSSSRPLKGKFVGRKREQEDFERSLKKTLSLPATLAEEDILYPHIFLIVGEGGMGKTSLAKEMLTIGEQTDAETIYIDAEHFPASTPESFMQILYGQLLSLSENNKRVEKKFTPYVNATDQKEQVRKKAESSRSNYDELVNSTASFVSEFAPPLTKKLVEKGVEEIVHAGARGIATGIDSFKDFIKQRSILNDAEFLLYENPQAEITKHFMECLGEVAEDTPLVISLDTYELYQHLDTWFRKALQQSSPQILWIISGRQNDLMLRRYRDAFQEEFIAEISITVFVRREIREYLDVALSDIGSIDVNELANIVQRVSQGVPLAVEALVNLIQQNVEIEKVFHDMLDKQYGRKEVVRRLTDRFLKWADADAVDDKDEKEKLSFYRRWILALALLGKYNRETIQTIINTIDKGTVKDADSLLEKLDKAFSFIFAEPDIEMHDLVRDVLREYLQENGLLLWLQHVANEAYKFYYLKTNVRKLQFRNNPLSYLHDHMCREYLLGLLNATLWKEGFANLAIELFIPIAIEAHYFDPDFLDDWIKLASEFTTKNTYHNQILLLWKSVGNAPVSSFDVSGEQVKLWSKMYEYTIKSTEETIFKYITLLNYSKIQASQGNSNFSRELVKEIIKTELSFREIVALFLSDIIDIANYLSVNGDFDAAVEITQLCTEIDNSNLFALSRIYLDHGKFETALSVIKEGIATKPDVAKYHSQQGYVLVKLARYDEAVASYEIALQIDSNNALYYRRKSVALENLTRYEDALEEVDRAIKLEPENALNFYYKATLLRQLGLDEETLEFIDKTIQLDPKDAHYRYYKGIILSNLGQSEGALECVDKAIQLNPKEVNYYYHKGIILDSQENYEGAIEVFEDAIKLNPNQSWSWFHKGLSLLNLSENEKALVAISRAIEIDPNHAQLYYIKSIALNEMGKNDDALESLNQAINLLPEQAEYHEMKGLILGLLGHHVKSIMSLEKFVEYNTDDETTIADACVMIGRIFVEKESYDDALIYYKHAIQSDPINADYQSQLGDIYRDLRLYNEALNAYNVAVEYDNSYLNGRGLIKNDLGKYMGALEDFRAAIALDEDDSVSKYNLVVTLLYTKANADTEILSVRQMFQRKMSEVDATTNDVGRALYALAGLDILMATSLEEEKKALSKLNEAILLNENAIKWAKTELAWKHLRDDDRFISIIDEVKVTNSSN